MNSKVVSQTNQDFADSESTKINNSNVEDLEFNFALCHGSDYYYGCWGYRG